MPRYNFTIKQRLEICDFFEQHGKNKTLAKFRINGNGNLKRIVKKKQQYLDEIQIAKNVDVQLSLKRKSDCHAAETRALKKRRVGNKTGFDRSEVYQWLDARVLRWFTEARGKKFCITPKMTMLFAKVECRQAEKVLNNAEYWYRSFRELNKITTRRISSLRRKVYTPEQLKETETQWRGFLRKWKLARNYPAELIINMDEIPLYMDMCRGWTLDVKGSKAVEVNFTNSNKLRFTSVAAVASDGSKLEQSAIFRLTKAGNFPNDLKPPFQHELQVYGAGGGSMTEDIMIMWLDDVLIPYIEARDGGVHGQQWTLLIMDPATPHITEAVRDHLKANRIDIAIMPASTTWKFQLIDVAIGKPFKDGIYEQWATWMLNENDNLGLTPAGNRKHPTRPNALDWVKEAWANIQAATILKTVPKVFMGQNPGPVVEGYDDDAEGDDEEIEDEREF